MPEKDKKSRKSPEKAKADRVYKHYKALRSTHDGIEFIATRSCESCTWSTFPHLHGYEKLVTPNGDWMLLARTHGLTVREVKDIVSKKRGWTSDKIVGDRENAIRVVEESNAAAKRVLREAGIE